MNETAKAIQEEQRVNLDKKFYEPGIPQTHLPIGLKPFFNFPIVAPAR
jgi:hypothetical protein